jgi:hypothetical protein
MSVIDNDFRRDNINDDTAELAKRIRILEEKSITVSAEGGGGDYVLVSVNDQLAGTLIDKLLAGAGITLSETGDGGYEQLGISIESHLTPNAHHNPVTAGDGITVTVQQVAVDSSVVRATLTITAGNGLTGGGDLSADRTLALTTPGSLTATSTNNAAGSHTHAIDATIARSAITITAGNGMTGGGDLSANRTLNVVAGNGLTVSADSIALTTPGSLTVSSTNTAVGNHTHAVTASSTPNGTATLLKTDSAGRLQYVELQHSTIGVPGEAADTSVVMTFNHRNQLANAGLIGTATYSVNGGTAVPLGNNPFDGSSSYVSIAAVAGDDIEIIVEIPTLVSNYGSAKWHPLVAVRNPLNNLTSLQPSTIEAFVSNDGITWYYASGDGWKTTSPETEWKLGGRLWLGTSAVPTLPVALPGYTWRYAKFVLGNLVGGTSYASVWLAHLGMIHTSHPGIPDFIGPNGGSIYNRLSFLTPSIGSTTANAYIDEDGSAKFDDVVLTGTIQTDNYVSRTTGWQVSYAGEADFRNIFAETLEVQTFIVDNVLATAGTEILTKSLGVLAEDMVVSDTSTTTLYVFDLPGAPDTPVFSNGDYVAMRHIDRTSGLIVGTVVGYVINYLNEPDGVQSWDFEYVSGTSGVTIYAGATALDYGTSGDGFIISTVADTYSPYTDVRTWATTIDNDTTHLRVGQLQGITAVDEYGIVAKISSQQQLIASDGRVEIHGAKLSLYQSATETLRLDPAVPSLAIGNPLPAFGDEGIWAGLHSGDYKFRVGNAVDYMLWDGTLLTVAGKLLIDGDSQFVGPVSLASGGGVYQGTGTFASPTTGLKIYNNSGIGTIRMYDAGNIGVALTDNGLAVSSEEIDVLDVIEDTNQYNPVSPNGVSSIQFKHTNQTDWSGFIQSHHANMVFLDGWDGVVSTPGYTEVHDRVVLGVGPSFGGTYISMLKVVSASGPGASHANVNHISYGATQHNFFGEVLFNSTLETQGDITSYGAIRAGDGLSVGTFLSGGTGNILYYNDILARRGGVNHTGYIYIPYTTAKTSTSWDGDAKTAANNGTLDLSAIFGIPANVKAISCRLTMYSGTVNSTVVIGPNSGQSNMVTRTQVANVSADQIGIVTCDANGDIYIAISGSMFITLIINGYFI